MKKPFLTSDDCEFLSVLESYPTLTELAEFLNVDKAYASRKASQVANKAHVLEKVNNKWRLTSQGKDIVQDYKLWVEKQELALNDDRELKMATTQVMSERVLMPRLGRLLKEHTYDNLNVMTDTSHIDELLLSYQVDFALVCQIPKTPQFRYKKIFKSPFVCVAIPALVSKKINKETIFDLPYVAHKAMNFRQCLKIEHEVSKPILSVDHMSGVREAVLQGLGWSILPLYAIEQEVKEKKLVLMKEIELDMEEEFQLWWLAGRMSKSQVDKLSKLFN